MNGPTRTLMTHLFAGAVMWGAGCAGSAGSMRDAGESRGGSFGGASTAGSSGTVGTAGTMGNGGTAGDAGTGGTTSSGGRGGNSGNSGSSGTTGGGGAGRGGSSGTMGGAGRGGNSGTTGGTGRGGNSGTTGGAATTGGAGRGGASAGTSGTTGLAGATGTGGSGTPGMPAVGAHVLSFLPVGQTATMITTPAITTRASGSVLVVNVGRGNNLVFSQAGAPPSDNKGNGAYPQVGQMEPYAHPYEGSGTALYAKIGATGGAGTQITALSGKATNGNYDEVTLAAVEVVGGTRIQDFQWNEVTSATAPITTKNVTTTGPAVLVAFWWGEAEISSPGGTTATNNGFQVIESSIQPGSAIQGAMAVRTVTAAGSYNVTWTSTPAQAAQLWLVAVQ